MKRDWEEDDLELDTRKVPALNHPAPRLHPGLFCVIGQLILNKLHFHLSNADITGLL